MSAWHLAQLNIAEVMRRRREWFTRFAEPFMVLWWVRAGTTPTIEEAKERLEALCAEGPTPRAFTFKRRFPAPDGVAGEPGSESRARS